MDSVTRFNLFTAIGLSSMDAPLTSVNDKNTCRNYWYRMNRVYHKNLERNTSKTTRSRSYSLNTVQIRNTASILALGRREAGAPLATLPAQRLAGNEPSFAEKWAH